MSHELAYTDQSDATLTTLENHPELVDLADEVHETLGRLSVDPGDRRLRTKTWQVETYGGVHMTPVGQTDWRVMWSVSTTEDLVLVIRYIGPMSPEALVP